MSVRILLAGGGTGGHLYPALAIGDAVRRIAPGSEVLFVGAERGIESRVLPERRVAHRLLPVEPIRRSRIWENWRVPVALARSLAQLRHVYDEFRPEVVVGTGGYASAPSVALATLRGIPTAIQEQNSYPGLTSRLLSRRVRELYLAFPEAREYLKPGRRTRIVEIGNPIAPPRDDIDRAEVRRSFGLEGEVIALVVGGSQGARAINEALTRDLGKAVRGEAAPVPEGLQLLWATGPKNFDVVRAALDDAGAPATTVRLVPYIDDMPGALAVADLAVSRAGAMALSELCAWGIPSILVPYPYATADHQRHNAAAVAGAGAAVMLPETDLESGRLWTEVRSIAVDADRRRTMSARAAERGSPDAAEEIAARLIALAGEAT